MSGEMSGKTRDDGAAPPALEGAGRVAEESEKSLSAAGSWPLLGLHLEGYQFHGGLSQNSTYNHRKRYQARV